METLTYSSGRASGCDSPGLLNYGATCQALRFDGLKSRPVFLSFGHRHCDRAIRDEHLA